MRKLLTTCLTLIIAFTFSVTGAFAGTLEINVQTPAQEEIVLYSQENPTSLVSYESSGKPESGYKITYGESPHLEEPYYAGTLSESELLNALNVIKTIRYIAGISDEVYLYDDYNSLTQAASIVNYANGSLTHTPVMPSGMDYKLAALGIEGAKNSNIAWTSWQNNTLKWTILNGWMDDSDAGNLAVLGHRRWILNPSMGMTGFGAVSGAKGTYNAMYIMDKSNPDDYYTGVCWPAANTPTSYFLPSSPWSISLGEEVSEDDVIVVLIKDATDTEEQKSWAFSKHLSDGEFYINNQSYGQKGCIIFRPEGISSYNAGDKFHVAVFIGEETTLRYDVTFFDLEKYYSTEAPSKPSVVLNDMNKPAVSWNKVKGADSYNIYRKARGGSWKLIAEELDECYFDDASAGKGIRYYYKITTNKEVNGTNYESDYSPSTYRTVPLGKPSITSLKATAKKTNYVKWGSVSKATGYEVYRRVSGSSKWTLMKTTTNKYYKNTSAKSGVKYQYRVRAYRVYNGYKVYSSYSSYKSVKTK